MPHTDVQLGDLWQEVTVANLKDTDFKLDLRQKAVPGMLHLGGQISTHQCQIHLGRQLRPVRQGYHQR